MNSRKSLRGTFTLGTLGAVILATSSCSVLYDFNTKQCNTDLDCTSKGTQFKYSVCQNNVCVATGGPAATGGSSNGGQSSTLPIGGDTSTLGGATQGGETATGGTPPGTGGAPPCNNKECMAANAASGLYTCINNECVPLTTTNCPVVLPQAAADPAYNYQKLLEAQSPIIIGGFASMQNAQNQHDTVAIVNWDMALAEFNAETQGGLPSADGSATRRPLIGLICNGNTTLADDVNAAMAHLVGDIKVPGILSTLSADNLITAFNYTIGQDYVNAGGAPVFFMSSSSANMALTTLKDNGLVWHMLPNPRLLAGTTASLLTRLEPVVNQARQDYATAHPGGPDDPAVPNSLRVTIVYSSNATMTDIANLLTGADPSHPETALTFNGASVADLLSNGALRTISMTSGSTDVSAVATEIQNNPPHIIIGMGTSEFATSVIPYLENVTWPQKNPTRMRPYYLLSHLLYNSTQLVQNTLKPQNVSVSPLINQRLVGVNYSQIQDTDTKALYQNYLTRLTTSYQSYAGTTGALLANLPGTENMYDAAYYLLYSVAAAAVNRTSFSGTSILSGLTDKVINVGGDTVYIGPTYVSNTINKLFTASFPPFAMSMWGCEGTPNFDSATGTRLSPTSAWCVQYDSTLSAWTYQADGLLYDSTNKVFTAPASGVPACLQNY